MSDFSTKEAATQSVCRNIAYCVHWGMYLRNMSEAELIERSGVSAKLVREILIGSTAASHLTVGPLGQIAWALDCRLTINLDERQEKRAPLTSEQAYQIDEEKKAP